MRITADIIDEEVEEGCQLCPEACKADLPKEWEKIEDDFKKATEPKLVEQERNWKFNDEQKLTGSDPQYYSNSSGHLRRDFSFTNMPDDKYKDMCSKFRNLNISGEENIHNKPYNKLYNEMLRYMEYRYHSDSCEMEKNKSLKEMTKTQPSSSKSKTDGENPPPWLLKYLQKMKQEIKEEIMEELKHLPRDEMQGHSASHEKIDESQCHRRVFHPGIFCDNCDQLIYGIRYKCGNCADFDLCEECESMPNIHNKNHRFLKIRYPTMSGLKHKMPSFILPAANEILAPCLKNYSSRKLYEAKFVCDETVPDGTNIPPSTTFIKSWRVLNCGKRVWTHSTKLQHIQGSAGFTPATEQVDVPQLRPGEEGIVSVLFTTPATPGVYRSHWNFCHKSRPFGHIVWCHIIVKDKEQEEKQKEKLPANGLPSENEKEIAKVLTAVKEEHEKGNIIPRKLAVNSHTATPNNTPFDLTPPKSPDHHVMNGLKVVVEDTEYGPVYIPVLDLTSPKSPDHHVMNELKVDVEDKESVPAARPVLEYEADDDEGSVVSLSSSDSDAEFVVIPMPNCFNLSESLASHNISHLSQYLQSENISDPKDLISGEKLPKPQNILKTVYNAETVSQETGVPELSEHSADHNEGVQKVFISHNVSSDGSSSEISIIESGDNSPTTENAVPDISTIRIAITDDTEPENGVDFDDNDKGNIIGIDKGVESPDKKNSTQREFIEKNKEQTKDIPSSSATFPKFPVEGITSIYEPASSNPEEQTVQVLPERMVTVPFNVASTVYNAAMQVMTNVRRYTDSQNNQEGATGTVSRAINPMDQLIEMGFCNRQQNEDLLKKHKNDVALVVGELVNLNDNDWYASRHVPPSAPTFD